jgi:hypothetical protein
MAAKDFQKKGAETQKETVRRKIAKAIADLRLQIKGQAPEARNSVTIDDVLVTSGVSIKTLERGYHQALLTSVEAFLVEVNVGAQAKPDRRRPRKKTSSVFRQNLVLAGLAEATRYEKQQEIDALKAELSVVTAERDALKAAMGKTLPRHPVRSQRSGQRKAA